MLYVVQLFSVLIVFVLVLAKQDESSGICHAASEGSRLRQGTVLTKVRAAKF